MCALLVSHVECDIKSPHLHTFLWHVSICHVVYLGTLFKFVKAQTHGMNAILIGDLNIIVFYHLCKNNKL